MVTLQRGDRFGTYEILECLSLSENGSVYHVSFPNAPGNTYALKVGHANSHLVLLRFEYEANIQSSLHYGNVLRFLHLGYNEEASCPYIVLPYMLPGSLSGRTPHDFEELITWVYQVAAGVDYLHSRGYIHRNIQPKNILMGADRILRISHFRSCYKRSGWKRIALDLLEVPAQVGNSLYLSPERVDGITHPTTDVYALAVMTCVWMAGLASFFSERTVGTCPNIALDNGQSLLMFLNKMETYHFPLAGTTKAGLKLVLQQALSTNPDDRYESAREFADSLKKVYLTKGCAIPIAHLL